MKSTGAEASKAPELKKEGTNELVYTEMPLDDLALGVFFDVGSAWFAADRQNPFDRLDDLVSQPWGVGEELDLKKSFGFGLEMGDGRLNIARALDEGGRGWEFSGRFGRSF